MDDRTVLICCFGVGVCMQVVLLLGRNISLLKILGCAALALIGMMPGKREQVYDPLFHILMTFSFFSFMVAFMFMKEILPLISEGTLLSYTAIFWFAFFSYYYHGTLAQNVLMGVAVLPTAIILYMVFDRENPGNLTKLVMYTWFLTIIVSIGFMQFPPSDLAIFYEEREVPWITPVESVTAGMAFMFLVANATYIFYLFPIPSKGQSLASRMEDWREFSDLLIDRFSNAQTTILKALVVLVGELSILLLNAVYHWVSTGLMINLAIVISGILLQHPFADRVGGAKSSYGASTQRLPQSRPLLKGKFRRG